VVNAGKPTFFKAALVLIELQKKKSTIKNTLNQQTNKQLPYKELDNVVNAGKLKLLKAPLFKI
jgi:hypothetical protein